MIIGGNTKINKGIGHLCGHHRVSAKARKSVWIRARGFSVMCHKFPDMTSTECRLTVLLMLRADDDQIAN